MTTSSVRVGCVRSESPAAEQRAAYDWCERTFEHAERVSLAALSERDLARYDVLWWHADEPIDPDVLAAVCGSLDAYLDGGGGLLLSLHALATASDLGIDPIGPDAVGVEHPPEPTGPLLKALHADHPAFEAFDGLRVDTAPEGTRQPFARYERFLPAEGDVLACAHRDGDVPEQKTIISWDRGAGTVVGAGAALAFDPGKAAHEADDDRNDGPRSDPHGDHDRDCDRGREPNGPAANRSRLVEGLLRFLAGGTGAGAAADAPLTTRPRNAGEFARVRRALRDDPNRPTYHLTAPANWCNDPNGLIQYNGRYHVFYQYNPAGPFHGTIHWGQAISDDLVHWEDCPVALSPSPDGPDADGCWSGCAVLDDGTPTVFYTGGRERRQLPCRATATDETLDTWEKDPANPVIEDPPADLDLLATDFWEAEFRDHCIRREGETWQHLIGSGITDVGGTVLLYESPDLREWQFRDPILTGDWEGAGGVWECPELLDLGEMELLHVSNYDEVLYFLGHLGEDGFEREGVGDGDEHAGVLDHGDFYAPQSLRTDDGRTLTWGWVIETRPPERQWDAGWSGALSIPRELSLSNAGDLIQRPARELEALRDDHVGVSDLQLAEESRPLDAAGTALEIEATVTVEADAAFELVVRQSPDGEERTPIRYTGEEVIVDREHANLDPAVAADPLRMPVENADDERRGDIDLRVFVDGSVIEVFANERHCLTSRVYPTRSDSTGLSIAAIGGRVAIETLDVWQLGSVWPAGDASKGRPAPQSSW